MQLANQLFCDANLGITRQRSHVDILYSLIFSNNAVFALIVHKTNANQCVAMNPNMEMANEFNQTFVMGFEKNFDEESFYGWISVNWTQCYWYSAIYVALIFAGKRYMCDRPKFEIRAALAVWSTILAVFSIIGAARTLPELVYVVRTHGWEYSMCSPSYFYGPVSFWAFMFTISKVYELGDTIFIILRKQNLIFLHWYHHVSVLIYVWYSYPDRTAPGRWFMVMNYTVHAIMYSYYALRAMRVRIPKQINICITAMQITQMSVGVVVNVQTYKVKMHGGFCQQSMDNIRFSSLMYFSYFVLFAYFFYMTYFSSSKLVDRSKVTKGDAMSPGEKKSQNGFVWLAKKAQ